MAVFPGKKIDYRVRSILRYGARQYFLIKIRLPWPSILRIAARQYFPVKTRLLCT